MPLLTCSPVLTEAAWLLRKHPAAVRRLLASVDGRFLKLLPLTEVDLPAITTILARYGNLELQIADACLLHLARREAIQTIFTLDRRDFSVVRTARGKKLRLIP